MKKLFILITILMSAALQVRAADSNIVLSYSRGASFSPHPSSLLVTIDDTGKVISTTKYFRPPQTITRQIGQLTKVELLAMSADIAALTDKSEAVDPNPDAPHCTDVGATLIFAQQLGKTVYIDRNIACHHWVTSDEHAQSLVKLISGHVISNSWH